MKKFILTSLLLSPLLNFAQYEIKGTAPKSENGRKVYLSKIINNNIVVVDSAQISQQKFQFKGKKIETELAVLQYSTSKSTEIRQFFILENGTILSNIENNSFVISGTNNNKDLLEFTKRTSSVQKEIQDFQDKNLTLFQKATQENDEQKVNELMNSMQNLQLKYVNTSLDFVKNNKNSYVSLIALTQLEQSIKEEDFITSFENLSNEVKNTVLGKEITNKIKKTADLQIGKKAPNFKANSPDGKEISLHDNLGKITIIDFWASWCGPCRKENPNVVKLYNKYKSKGLQIVGVSLDKDENSWKKAIEKDELSWIHLSNLKFWEDPIAKLYNISSIPATYILDENGTIIAKNLRGEDLENKIAELLK